jgi:C-terminal processing protease CtpA/Prc
VISGAIEQLVDYYVFPEMATRMGDSVRARLKRGEYDSVSDGYVFARLLTTHFQDVGHDKHLRVSYSPVPVPDAPPDRNANPNVRAAMVRQMIAQNCGFATSEHLARNVGYLKFNMFAPTDVCGSVATREITPLADVDALIIDLRDNGGGDPDMVRYVASYVFSRRTHINDIWTRRGNRTEEFWTLAEVPGKRLKDETPVYVLTSSRTFSGGEEFTYDLKMQHRATIVGETTGGGAHPVSGHRIDDHFMIGVPFARAINPISHANWEGIGVEPDVKVPASGALEAAQKLIAERARKPKPN